MLENRNGSIGALGLEPQAASADQISSRLGTETPKFRLLPVAYFSLSSQGDLLNT